MAASPEKIDGLLEEYEIGEGTFYERLVELMDECDTVSGQNERFAIVRQLIVTYKLMLRRLGKDQSAIADLYESFYCDVRHLQFRNLVSDIATIDLRLISEEESEVVVAIEQLASIARPEPSTVEADSPNAKPGHLTTNDRMILARDILTKLKRLEIGHSLAEKQLRQLHAGTLDPHLAIFNFLHHLKQEDLGKRAMAIYTAFEEFNVHLMTAPCAELEHSVGLSAYADQAPRKGTSSFRFLGSKNKITGLWTDDRKLPESVTILTSRKGYDPHRADKRAVVSILESVSEAKLHKRRSTGNA